MGEHSAVVWKLLNRRPCVGESIDVGRVDVGAEAAEVAEAGVVEDDDDDVGCARRRARPVGPPGFRLRRRRSDRAEEGLSHCSVTLQSDRPARRDGMLMSNE